MGLFDSIGKALGFGGGGGRPTLDQSKFDLSAESKRYEDLLAAQRDKNLASSDQLTQALQQQASGQGPLANAALKSAQERNLAQTLAAAQSMNASPLSTRQVLQQRGQQSRDTAQLGMQERLASQQALGSQLQNQANMGTNYATTGFGIARAPKDLMSTYETNRFNADVARDNAIKAQQAAIGGALLGSAGTALGGYLSKATGGTVPGGGGGGRMLLDSRPYAHGGAVKAPEITPEDSEVNDIVPTMLSGGELVIPKTVVKSGHKAISEFAKKLLEIEQKNGPHESNGYAALVAMKSKGKKDK